jgi:hypothetical protein
VSADPLDSMPAGLLEKLARFANEVAWKQPDLNVLKAALAGQYPLVAVEIENQIKRSDQRRRLVLPDLRAHGNQTVAVFTDYGGEHKGARYFTYSTLVCGWNLTAFFSDMMKIVRARHALGEKEIEFKDLRMGQLARALPEYLTALDAVPGFLFTLAVDKRLGTVFGPEGKDTRELIVQALAAAGLDDRNAELNEKLLRVVHIAAFLTGLLAHDQQKIFWMTDHDDVVATRELHDKALSLFGRLLNIYARDSYRFPCLGGAVPFEERNLDLLDLLSATDIVAGSVEQYLSRGDSVPPEDILVKQGCDRVLQWLARDGVGLKKMNVIMRPGIATSTFEFNLENPPAAPQTIPINV